MKGQTYYTVVPSPIGELTLTARDDKLTGLFVERPEPPAEAVRAEEPFEDVIEQLDRYWRGEQKTFDVAIEPTGTPFQESVWRALLDIPYGETISYRELAEWIGNPRAVRAVGAANGRNPISIIVPCHRVIGSDGSLVGYGWGLERKQTLLDLEAGRGK